MQVEVVKHSDDTVQGMFDSFDNDDFEEAFTSLDPDDVVCSPLPSCSRASLREERVLGSLR